MLLKIKNEEETRRFGLSLASQLMPGDIVCLTGDLGTGKTALTKAIAEGLGVTENIISPTFNIVKEYHSGRLPLYHFDVYRLGSPQELFEIGADQGEAVQSMMCEAGYTHVAVKKDLAVLDRVVSGVYDE